MKKTRLKQILLQPSFKISLAFYLSKKHLDLQKLDTEKYGIG